MNTCPHCGSNVDLDARFCAACGQAVGAGVATEPEPVVIPVPHWLTTDWAPASALAGTSLLILVAANVVVALLYAAGLGLEQGFSRIDWGNVAEIPVTMSLAMMGGVAGLGVWITGLAWMFAAFAVAHRLGAAAGFDEDPGGFRLVALRSVKVAVVVAALATVGFVMFEPNPIPLSGASGLPSTLGALETLAGWKASAGVTFVLLTAFVSVLVLLWWPRRHEQATVGGRAIPAELPAAIDGARRFLAIALPATVAVVIVGASLTEVIDQPGVTEWLGDLLLTIVEGVAWSGVDLGLGAMGAALSFFSGGFEVAGGAPRWLLLATVAVAAGYAAGGFHAVRTAGVRTLGRLVAVAALVGLIVAGLFVVVAVIDGAETVAAGAAPLALVWSVVAVAGGLVHGRSVGVVPVWRIRVVSSATGAADGEQLCDCGVVRRADHRFCANCGRSFG